MNALSFSTTTDNSEEVDYLYLTSEITRWMSVACWVIVFTPQLWANYKRKSGESLSLLFLYIWLIGDIFCIVGLILSQLDLFQIILAGYYAVVDCLMIIQVYYYRRRRKLEEEVFHVHGASAKTPLLQDAEPSGSTSSNSVATLHNPSMPWNKTLLTTMCLLGMTAFTDSHPHLWATNLHDQTVSVSMSKHQDAKVDACADLLTPVCVMASIFGYASALLYVGSRVPQIWKNFKTQSCEGLSVWLFLFSVLGNSLYVASLVLDYLSNRNEQKLIKNIPYLLGSGGTLFFDMTIFLQFFMYAPRRYEQVVEINEY